MLKRNLIANYVGQGWAAFIGLVFIPWYVRLLGPEAYGLVGVFAMLQACFGLLDIGLTPTLGREMARFTGGTHSVESIRDLLRSVEVVAGIVAALMTLGVWALSGWMAHDWLRLESLPRGEVQGALVIMGFVTALRFVEGVFRSCLVGLERQVQYNIINSSLATFRAVGALVVLRFVSASPRAFFLWQGLISVCAVVALAIATYHCLPPSTRAGRFSRAQLWAVRHYAGGMVGIAMLTLVLTQMDKLLLSRLLQLSEFGYYTLAASVAGVVNLAAIPITQAWFPRLSALQAAGDESELANTYHEGAQLVSVIVGSVGIVLVVLADPVLNLWTRSPDLTRHTSTLVSM